MINVYFKFQTFQYAPNKGSTECYFCENGHVDDEKQTCTPCPPGTNNKHLYLVYLVSNKLLVEILNIAKFLYDKILVN